MQSLELHELVRERRIDQDEIWESLPEVIADRKRIRTGRFEADAHLIILRPLLGLPDGAEELFVV